MKIIFSLENRGQESLLKSIYDETQGAFVSYRLEMVAPYPKL